MPQLKPTHLLPVFCGLLLTFAGCGRQQSTLDIQISKVGRRTVVFTCLGNNVAAVTTRAGLVIIDTHRSPWTMAAIRKRIEAETGRRDILMVVNTHGDWDHCSGNQVFPDRLLYGHRNCPAYMRNNPADAPAIVWPLRRRIAGRRADGGAESRRPISADRAMLEDLEKNYRVSPPFHAFEDTMTVDGGDAAVELAWAGNAHTDNDVLVYVPQERLLFTGDLFTSASSFGFSVDPMADVPRLLRVLDRFLARGVDFAVPGHGRTLTCAEVRSLRALLAERYAEYDGKRSAAHYLEQSIAECGLRPALKKYEALPRDSKRGYYRSQEELSILGWRLLGKGKNAEAHEAFAAALREFPKSALIYQDMGDLHLALGERDSARHYLRLALQALPGNRTAAVMLECLDSEGR